MESGDDVAVWIIAGMFCLLLLAVFIFFVQWAREEMRLKKKRRLLPVIAFCGECAHMRQELDPCPVPTYRTTGPTTHEDRSVRRVLCAHPSGTVEGQHTKEGVLLEDWALARSRSSDFRQPGFRVRPPASCPMRVDIATMLHAQDSQ